MGPTFCISQQLVYALHCSVGNRVCWAFVTFRVLNRRQRHRRHRSLRQFRGLMRRGAAITTKCLVFYTVMACVFRTAIPGGSLSFPGPDPCRVRLFLVPTKCTLLHASPQFSRKLASLVCVEANNSA